MALPIFLAVPLGPTLTITTDRATLGVGDTATITFTFSEDPGATFTWNGSSGDVSVTGGTVSAISGSALIRTATFTPTPGTNAGSASISVAAGSYVDGSGNPGGAGSPLTITYDTLRPSAPAVPRLDAGSDSGANSGDGVTAVRRPSFHGDAGSVEANATVALYDSDGVTQIGSATALADGSWQATVTSNLMDGVHLITAKAVDGAGNASSASPSRSVTVDSSVPVAPASLALATASDTGALGDGRTTDSRPTIEGVAEVGATVVLYDGATEIGRTTANADGKWGVVVPLSVGSHSLKATQQDTAGNLSVTSAAFALIIESPPVPPSPPDNPGILVDGVLVQTGITILPGGIAGSTLSIPVVTSGRAETGGAANVADIPLASAGAASLLVAQLPVGYGMTASGSNVSRAVGMDLLNAMMKATMPTQGAGEQAQLLATGQTFLSQQPGDSPILITTIAPISTMPSATVPLTLSSAGAPDAQRVALVIDTKGLAATSKLDLLDVDFAAVIGQADISVRGGGAVISGDGAVQYITVAAGRGDTVFAGAGNDVINADLSSSATGAKATTVLHGGQGKDLVRFSGSRDDYVVEQHQGHVIVSSKADPALRTQVINAEQLQFGDAVADIANAGSLNTLAGIYQAVLGRQADVNGIEFWANGRAAGASWGAIAVNFINASERIAATQSGFNGDAQHDVTLLFNALFGRAPDAEGLAFWTKALGDGASLVQVANGFVESVEMIGHQVAATDWNFRV